MNISIMTFENENIYLKKYFWKILKMTFENENILKIVI